MLAGLGAAGTASATTLTASFSSTSATVAAATAAMRAELARTQPDLRFDVRLSVMYGSDDQVLDAVRLGALDMTALTSSVATPLVPELGLIDLPFVIRDQAHAKAVLDGAIGQSIAARFRDKGVVVLAFGEQGFRHLTNGRRPVRTPADLAGLKIRVLPNEVYQLTFGTLGAQALPMPFTQVYAALRDGRIDGQENPAAVTLGSRFAEVQKFMTLTGHFYASTLFLMNRDSFDAMPEPAQRTLLAAARTAADTTRRLSAESEKRDIDTLKGQGIQVVEGIDREAFAKALAPAMPEFERRFGAETIRRLIETR